MSESTDKAHFSDRVLDLAERFQKGAGHTKVGQKIIRQVTGSSSSAYTQLDWRSQKVTAEINSTSRLPGNPEAGLLARNWTVAGVMVTQRSTLDELKQEFKDAKHQEAVAYISDKAVHVGTKALGGVLFEQLDDLQVAIAMRMGKGPMDVAMGIWIPSEREFIGNNDIEVVNHGLNIADIPAQYPGINLA